MGTPLVQFDELNQLLSTLPVQIVRNRFGQSAASAPAGEAQSARAATMSRSTFFFVNFRGVCEVDFVFMSGYEVGLLNDINCNPVPRGTRNHPREAL